MNREQKSNYVSSLKESLNNNEAMMIYHYQGLNVNQLDDLRNQMREAGALLKVTKNRITKIALKDTQHEEAISLFRTNWSSSIKRSNYFSENIS